MVNHLHQTSHLLEVALAFSFKDIDESMLIFFCTIVSKQMLNILLAKR